MPANSHQSTARHIPRNPPWWFAMMVFLILAFSAGCQPVPSPPPAAPDVEIKGPFNVLVLNSYHIGYAWSEDIINGINSTFSKGTIHPEIFVEYMDTKRYAPEDIFPSLIAMYTSKYEHTPLDLIILVDNNALSFMATYHDQLFPDVPVIFLGVNGFTPEMLGTLTDVTGISESIDERKTIDLILQLLPETQHLVTITDSTVTGEIHLARFQELSIEYADQLDFIFLAGLSADELAAELAQLPENSVIFFRSFFRSVEGESITVEEALRLITQNSAAPIFTTWDFTLGEGVVGGALLTGQSQGRAAGELALQILQGTPAASIPILPGSPTEIILDYNELQRYDIPAAAIPANSTILNQPVSFYRQYLKVIRIGGFFVLAQTVIISILITAVRRRKKAENELSAAEQWLDRMLQTVVDGVIVINHDVTVSYLNPAVRRLLDIPDTVQSGDPLYDHIHWIPIDDHNYPVPFDTVPLLAALKTGKETANSTYRFINADAEIKWLTISAAPILNDDAELVGAIASLSDTTARQFAMQAMQKSEKRFRTLFEQVVDAIIICELDGRVVDANHRACDMLGYTRNELLNLTAFDLSPQQEEEAILAAWRRLGKGDICLTEGKYLRKNGTTIPAESSIGLIELDDQDRILVVSRDSTERQQARQILLEERALLEQRVAERTAELQRLNAELHKAARAKDDFLANMSHELRTPLNAVLGMSEMLGEELHGPLNPSQHKYIKIIENSGRHLLDLINDILDLSKIEAGQKNLHYQLVQIDDLCIATQYFVEQTAHEKGVEIIYQNNSHQTELEADPRSAKQIFVNLLANAIKFSLENGKITFTVDDAPGQNALRFTISDQGIGINPEMMPRLFKPFSQIDSSLSRNYEGTGLGLALVSRLVAMHGGSTSLNSTGHPGEGAVFIVTLPLDQQPQPAPLADWGARYNPAHPLANTVLLGEEDQTVIQTITSALVPLGCQVHLARTGITFLQQARANPPQILLLNMQLPEMDGWQILSILKEEQTLKNIPILCFTSLMVTGDPQRYADAGVSKFMLKPFSVPPLLEWLESQRP